MVRSYIVRSVVSVKRCTERVSASDLTAGAVLRQAGQAAASTPREVAARVGVHRSVVSAYEGGGPEPSLASLSNRSRRAA